MRTSARRWSVPSPTRSTRHLPSLAFHAYEAAPGGESKAVDFAVRAGDRADEPDRLGRSGAQLRHGVQALDLVNDANPRSELICCAMARAEDRGGNEEACRGRVLEAAGLADTYRWYPSRLGRAAVESSGRTSGTRPLPRRSRRRLQLYAAAEAALRATDAGAEASSLLATVLRGTPAAYSFRDSAGACPRGRRGNREGAVGRPVRPLASALQVKLTQGLSPDSAPPFSVRRGKRSSGRATSA